MHTWVVIEGHVAAVALGSFQEGSPVLLASLQLLGQSSLSLFVLITLGRSGRADDIVGQTVVTAVSGGETNGVKVGAGLGRLANCENVAVFGAVAVGVTGGIRNEADLVLVRGQTLEVSTSVLEDAVVVSRVVDTSRAVVAGLRIKELAKCWTYWSRVTYIVVKEGAVIRVARSNACGHGQLGNHSSEDGSLESHCVSYGIFKVV